MPLIQSHKERPYIYAILAAISLITFYPLMFTGLATADDLHFYIIAQRGMIWDDTVYFAGVTGRFYFFIVKIFYHIPYIVDHPAFTKVLLLVPIFLCIIIFWKILKMVSETETMPALFFLLFMVTMQISRHTSVFVAYPLYFTFSFFLLLWSFYQLLLFLKRGARWHWIFSVVLFLFGLLFYEPYLFFIVFVVLAVGSDRLNAVGKIRQRTRQAIVWILPYVVIALLYVAAYFIYRHYFPPVYEGSSFAKGTFSIINFFKVLWKLSETAFPLTVYETSHTIFWDKSELITGYSPVIMNLIMNAKVEWLTKGALVAFIGYRILYSTDGIPLKKALVYTFIALLMIFLPHILLTLTDKYIYYVNSGSMIGYITTYYSFFGVTFLFSAWIIFMMGKLNVNKPIKAGAGIILTLGFFLCSVITDFSNYTIAKDMRSANLRIYAMDDLIKTDQFKAIPPNSPFYARTLYESPSISAPNITEQEFNWCEYFDARLRNFYPIGRVDSLFLDFASQSAFPSWYLAARHAEKSDEISLVLAKMAKILPTDTEVNHFADTATVLYYSSYKCFTVSFRLKNSQFIRTQIGINHIRDTIAADGHVEFTVFNTKKGTASTIFTVIFPGIDLSSIMISDMIDKRNPVFYL